MVPTVVPTSPEALRQRRFVGLYRSESGPGYRHLGGSSPPPSRQGFLRWFKPQEVPMHNVATAPSPCPDTTRSSRIRHVSGCASLASLASLASGNFCTAMQSGAICCNPEDVAMTQPMTQARAAGGGSDANGCTAVPRDHVAHVCTRRVPLASRQSTSHNRHPPNTGQRGVSLRIPPGRRYLARIWANWGPREQLPSRAQFVLLVRLSVNSKSARTNINWR